MENGVSLADIAAVTDRNNDGMFGGSGMWIFALLILAMLGGGGFGWGGNNALAERAATVGDVQRSTDFAALERQNNEGVAATRQAMYDVTTAVKDGNFNILGELRDIQAATSAGFAQQQNCCCEIQRGIDSVNYNGAINTAAINANTTAQTQKILDAMCSNRMAEMQNQINQLQLQAALCGVPRTNPYGYSIVPSFGAGCCCGSNAM